MIHYNTVRQMKSIKNLKDFLANYDNEKLHVEVQKEGVNGILHSVVEYKIEHDLTTVELEIEFCKDDEKEWEKKSQEGLLNVFNTSFLDFDYNKECNQLIIKTERYGTYVFKYE